MDFLSLAGDRRQIKYTLAASASCTHYCISHSCSLSLSFSLYQIPSFCNRHLFDHSRVNVDLLHIIQLGLAFADHEGNFAPGAPCYQFNFKFSLKDDMYAQDSIDLLVKSGISFDDHEKRGIDPHRFGELLMVSGLVLDDRVKWVSFHSGYDYGYLLKLLTVSSLPDAESKFFELLFIYFPTIYDIKYMCALTDGFFGGLQKCADDLGCERIGTEHQAGSDALLTMSTYFKLAQSKFSNNPENAIDATKYKNELYGYGSNHTVRSNKGASVD
jgi:CCR4-NOT transcription complex subunit 7/8